MAYITAIMSVLKYLPHWILSLSKTKRTLQRNVEKHIAYPFSPVMSVFIFLHFTWLRC